MKYPPIDPKRLQTKLLIGGRWVAGVAGRTIPVVNPYSGEVICDIAEADGEDVDLAVTAAQEAALGWAALPAHERGRLLLRLADAIEADTDYLARLEATNTGHPIRDCLNLDVPRTVLCFRYFGGMADKLEGSVIPVDAGFLNYVAREPIGVVGQIVPWNFPLMFVSWKLGPALAAGNTVVIKPSEITPLSTLRIGELIKEVGIPDGVVNIVPVMATPLVSASPNIQISARLVSRARPEWAAASSARRQATSRRCSSSWEERVRISFLTMR